MDCRKKPVPILPEGNNLSHAVPLNRNPPPLHARSLAPIQTYRLVDRGARHSMLTELALLGLVAYPAQFADESWLPGPIGPLTPRMTRAHHLPGHEAAGKHPVPKVHVSRRLMSRRRPVIGRISSQYEPEAIGGANFARIPSRAANA